MDLWDSFAEWISTENADHAVKVFETEIVDEALHNHVGRALAVSHQEFEIVVPQDSSVSIDGIHCHLSSYIEPQGLVTCEANRLVGYCLSTWQHASSALVERA